MTTTSEERRVARAITGALRSTIHAHGPITPRLVNSAVKRILGQLRALKRQELRQAEPAAEG